MQLQGIDCGRERAAKLLRIAVISVIEPKSFKPRTTDRRRCLGYNENRLLKRYTPHGINPLSVGDITYTPIAQSGFAYPAMLVDRLSQRIVGWCIDFYNISRLHSTLGYSSPSQLESNVPC